MNSKTFFFLLFSSLKIFVTKCTSIGPRKNYEPESDTTQLPSDDDLPLLPFSEALDDLETVCHSTDDTTKNMAINFMQDISKALKQTSKQYIKALLGGVHVLIDLGAPGSVTRGENEERMFSLMDFVKNIFMSVFKLFGYSEVSESEIDDYIFQIHVDQQTLSDIERFVIGKKMILEHINKSKHQIQDEILKDVKQTIKNEESFINILKIEIDKINQKKLKKLNQ